MKRALLPDPERAQRADLVIRIVSPEMAAAKLGMSVKAVLARRAELGLGEHKPHRNRRPGAKPQTPANTKVVRTKANARAVKKPKATAAKKTKDKAAKKRRIRPR